MSGLVAKRILGSLPATRLVHRKCGRRTIHMTPIVQKKKNKVDIDDLFADGGIEELITSDASKASAAPTSVATTAEQKAVRSRKRKLTPAARLAQFNQISEFVTPRLGRKPAVKIPQVRKSAWVHLVGLATTEEQLTQVAEMFPGWKESGHEFDPKFSELFVRRCEELSCPLLALKVFGNYSKYNLKLTLQGGRQLLHSLHVNYPINNLITASALYGVYSLTPIAQDLPSCSMLVSACFRHNTKDSLQVANALVPHLEQLLKKTKPQKVGADPVTDKSKLWVKWTLKKVDKALYTNNGDRVDWMKVWRTKSGHIEQPSKF